MILPIENFESNSRGEDFCWNQMKKILPANYVSFHNYLVGTQQVDWILLVPDFGVLVIEIKGFNPDSIMYAIDNTNVLLKSGVTERSPYLQSLRYWKAINKKIKLENEQLKKVYVAKAVCYPYLSAQDIVNKQLNKLCDMQLIINRDDLASIDAFGEKIRAIFTATYEVNLQSAECYGFSEELLKNFADFISPNCFEVVNEENEENHNSEFVYSHLLVSKSSEYDGRIDGLFNEWKNGTKVFYFSTNRESVEGLKKKIKEYITEIGVKNLISEDEQIFNCTLLYSPRFEKEIEIINGVDADYYRDELITIGQIISFNAEQYLVEHSQNEDIIVKAGAGTGKTYLLVSRIAYLIWKNSYTEQDILHKLVLITFTNDATDEMKSRLEAYYSNMFSLTYNMKYFSFVEIIENMRISTIDSLSLRIIRKFAYFLGMGDSLSAYNGTVEKKQFVHEAINEKAQESVEGTLSLDSIHIERILLDTIKKFEDKNIDLREEGNHYFEPLESETDIVAPYMRCVPQIVEKIENACEEKGRILTGHIMIYLQRIASMLRDKKIVPDESLYVDHLFIDEFQDTDDAQIELVSQFKKIMGFNLFVVGDVKQSIYRFRGAIDDRAFKTLEEKLGYSIDNYPLKKNYRTNRQLLMYMDRVFKKMARTRSLLKYTQDDELVGVKNPHMPKEVVCHPITSEGERDKFIADYIKEFNRNAGAKDSLGILVRRRSEITRIRDICSKYGILNVDIDVGGQLYKYESTIDFYKLVMALLFSNNATYLYNLYTTSYVYESLDKTRLLKSNNLLKEFHDNPPSTLRNWDDYLKRLHTEPVLKILRDIVDTVSPWDIYWSKVSATGEEAEICRKRYRNNLEMLFEKIAVDFNGNYLTLNSLANFLSIMITTDQEEEERELDSDFRIQCRTVHRAKGKEYTYVLLPFADDPITMMSYPGSDDIVVNIDGLGYSISVESDGQASTQIHNAFYDQIKSRENDDKSYEEARIVYVAVTRAKRGIAFIKNASKQGKNIVRWQDVLEVENGTN